MTLPKDRADAKTVNDADRLRTLALLVVTNVPRNQWLTFARKLTPDQEDAITRELDGLVADLAALRQLVAFRTDDAAPRIAARAWRQIRTLFSYRPDDLSSVRGWFTPRDNAAPLVPCPDCDGEGGEFDREGPQDCKTCRGSGMVPGIGYTCCYCGGVHAATADDIRLAREMAPIDLRDVQTDAAVFRDYGRDTCPDCTTRRAFAPGTLTTRRGSPIP